MLNSVEQTKPIMQLSVTLGSVPACWAKERAKARDRSDPTLAAWHCWETKVQRSYLECVVWDAEACVGSLEPDTQARRCQLPCPILRAFMRKDLGNNFLSPDQDNVWEVRRLRFQFNKKRTFHTMELSKTTMVIFNESNATKFSGTAGQSFGRNAIEELSTGNFRNRQQGYFKDFLCKVFQGSVYTFKHLSFR